MGNDGGSIPTRRELVKNAARAPTVGELKATALESLAHAWAHCALSGLPLDLETVVSDWRGRLYNYEAILKGLIPSDDNTAEPTPASLGIRSLRDVAKLRLAKNDDKWVCPISMKELGPSTKSVYLVPCGHVFAEVAIAEIQEKTCPKCGEETSRDNIITVLPTTDKEVGNLQKRIDDLREKGLSHTLKKDKSEKKKKKRKGDDVKEEERENGVDNKEAERHDRKPKDADARVGGINNPMAASLTARVLAEQDEKNKRRKMATGETPRRGEAIKG